MRRISIGCLLLPALFLMFGLAPGADANPIWPGFFELTDRPYSLDIPPDGSVWESLIGLGGQVNLIVIDQVEFEDSGDGIVSPGDVVNGPPQGPGYPTILIIFASRLYRLEENDWVLKPVLESGGSPVGETWEILLPANRFGETHLVQAWTGTGEPQAGDGVELGGVSYTIQSIDLVVEADSWVPVEPTTWGRVKAWLRDAF